MKRLSDQTLYEIIEVPVDARPDEIERACDRAAATYGAGSLVTYTLASPEETSLLSSRIEEARAVLLDPGARSRYDERIGAARPVLQPAERALIAPPVERVPVAEPVATPAPPTWPAPEPASPRQVSPGLPPASASPISLGPPLEPAPAAAPAQAPPAASPVGPPALAPDWTGEAAPPAGPASGPVAAPGPAPRPIPLTVAASPAATRPAGPILLEKEVPLARDPVLPQGSAWSGEMLRRVRESRGLSVQQVAERTRITRHHLENIEQDRFKALPAPVYLRGIIMSLARELRLDGQKVARSYLDRMGAASGGAS